MGSGGARNRSGPQADPTSGRSDRRGFSLSALPAEGYDGPVPEFPLPLRLAYIVAGTGPSKVALFDQAATDLIQHREQQMWEWAWSTPQACAWARPSESWRLPLIAMWIRTFVLCESSEATAADKNSLHRFADQIGLTPAGLKENGWKVAPDELAGKAAEREAQNAADFDDDAEPAPRRLRDASQ